MPALCAAGPVAALPIASPQGERPTSRGKPAPAVQQTENPGPLPGLLDLAQEGKTTPMDNLKAPPRGGAAARVSRGRGLLQGLGALHQHIRLEVLASVAGALIAVAPGCPRWASTYADRLSSLRDRLLGLEVA